MSTLIKLLHALIVTLVCQSFCIVGSATVEAETVKMFRVVLTNLGEENFANIDQ